MALDVKRLRQERVYETRLPLDIVESECGSMEDLAVSLRSSRRQFQLIGAVTLLCGLIGLILYWPVGVVLAATSTAAFFRVRQYPKAIASNVWRCALLKSVTRMLAHDVDHKSRAAIRLAFDPQRELLGESKLANRKNGRQQTFKAPWFSLEADLHDGTTFTETIDDLVRRRSFTNPRGKSKVKTRVRSLLGMRFAYRSKVYGDVSKLAKLMQQEMKLPAGASLREVEVTGRVIKVKAVVTNADELARASSMLALGVYRVMNLSREIEARKRSQQKSGGAR
jgi:hypothetical protein